MRMLIIFALVFAACGNPGRSFAQSAHTEDRSKTADHYKPTYTEDTAIIRFMMKDGTTVWARLCDDPISRKRIIEDITFNYAKDWALDFDELKSDLQILITDAYKNNKDPNLKEVIETEVNKEIAMQKKYVPGTQEK